MFEDELVPMFEPHGTIYEFRLMVDSMSGLNKGFAFCTYTTNEDAKEAVKALDKKVMKDGKILGNYLFSWQTLLLLLPLQLFS